MDFHNGVLEHLYYTAQNVSLSIFYPENHSKCMIFDVQSHFFQGFIPDFVHA